MTPRIETLAPRLLVGQRLRMSFAANRTSELWRGFMPRRHEVPHQRSDVLYALQVYPQGFFASFNPQTTFEKWAAVEVASADAVPQGMEAFALPGGLYAVFLHQGASTDNSTFQYIFQTWLPQSEYVLDDRPHFERLDERYKNNDPSSEEEIWVPIARK